MAEPATFSLRTKIEGSSLRDKLVKMGKSEAEAEVPGAPEPSELVSWITGKYHESFGVVPGGVDGLIEALIKDLQSGKETVELWYLDGRKVRCFAVKKGGLLGKVAEAAERHDRDYLWDRWEATRWLVCGGSAPVPNVFRWKPERRVLGATDTTTRVLLEVDPTLTPADVAGAYGRVRQRIYRGERVRPLDDKALALYRLVLDRELLQNGDE